MRRVAIIIFCFCVLMARDTTSTDTLKMVESETDIMEEYSKVSGFYALGINTKPFFLSKNISPKVKPEDKTNMLFSFFTTSCVPCRKEIPFLQNCVKKYNIKKAYLINIRDRKEKVVEYLATYQYNMKVLHDPYATISKKLSVASTPSLLVVSGDGDLLYRHDGFDEKDTTEIDEVLKSYFSRETE